MNILGISAFYHDSAAVLVQDGEIVAAAQEERFSRKKHDARFPQNALKYCLSEGRVGPEDLDAVAFYDKPILKFSRIIETYFSVAPKGISSFVKAMPVWMKEKLWIPYHIEVGLRRAGISCPDKMFFPAHHESHAASAFFPSPFKSAAVLTIDGVGEWATTTMGFGDGRDLEMLSEMRFPHSLGLLYSAFTYFTGFRVNSGEYKLMGLAPYGDPRYVDTILESLIDLKEDGSFRLNMDYFGYHDGLRMTNARFASLFCGPPRDPETEITKREMDLARSIQVVTEEIVLRMARHAYKVTGSENLCLAGGVALNCVSNGRVLREGPFKNVWVQPAAGDAGGALGAALFAWHVAEKNPREAHGGNDSMKGAYLGPGTDDLEIEEFLGDNGYSAIRLCADERAKVIAKLIDSQRVIGLCQGRMEFGPRALGNRSIIGDARSSKMQSVMNQKIKYRESFRPFAPSCLEERVGEFFDIDRASPYMLFAAQVAEEHCIPIDAGVHGKDMLSRMNAIRSDLPAITHVDLSARIQTVSKDTNPYYYDIIREFEKLTGVGVVINTSFNVRGEPIVCTPEDAYACFMRTEMDYLVLGDFLLKKTDQPVWQEKRDWRDDHVLD